MEQVLWLFDCFRLIKLLKEKHYFNSCKAFSNMWATAILSLISRQERYGNTAGGQGGWVAIHAGGVGGEKEPLQGAIGG